jgi:hypothetical protein
VWRMVAMRSAVTWRKPHRKRGVDAQLQSGASRQNVTAPRAAACAARSLVNSAWPRRRQ